jgi:hypothetical protein
MIKLNIAYKRIMTLVMMLLITSLITNNSFAQTIEITPSYGYQFGAKLNYGQNYIKIDDSGQYGINLGFEVFDDFMAEISYFHQGTELRIRDIILSPIEDRLSDLSVDWINIGGTKYFPSGKIRPFVGGAIGIVIFSPKNENFNLINSSLDVVTKFSFTFKGGVNFMFSDRIGLNFQGNLMFPVDWGGVYVGGGPGGVGGGVSASSTTVIGGFSAGLVFRLK